MQNALTYCSIHYRRANEHMDMSKCSIKHSANLCYKKSSLSLASSSYFENFDQLSRLGRFDLEVEAERSSVDLLCCDVTSIWLCAVSCNVIALVFIFSAQSKFLSPRILAEWRCTETIFFSIFGDVIVVIASSEVCSENEVLSFNFRPFVGAVVNWRNLFSLNYVSLFRKRPQNFKLYFSVLYMRNNLISNLSLISHIKF